MFGAVNHNRCETVVNAFLADIEIFTVVKMQSNIYTCIFYSGFYQLLQVYRLCVFSRACGNLQNQRGLFYLSGLDDALDDFHVVDIKCTDCVITVDCFRKHFLGCN